MSLRTRLPLLLLLLGSEIVLALAASQAVLLFNSTLASSGHWLSTKATLARSVMGAQSFLRGRQSVGRTHLNLGSWFGYQEVLFHRPLSIAELEFDFELHPGAYVNLVFAHTEQGFAGLRLSLNPDFPSQFFTASAIGEFVRRNALGPLPLGPREWHHVTAAFAPDAVGVRLDGREVGRFELPLPQEQTFGFRGGRRIALVRDPVIRQRGADPLQPGYSLRESFGAAGAARLAAWSLLAIAALNTAGLVAVRRLVPARAWRPLLLGTIVANGVTTVLFGLGLGYLWLTAGRYPTIDRALREGEAAWRVVTTEEVRSEIHRRYPRAAPADTTRILFVGTSQTWGAGASKPGETFVEVAERLLSQQAGPARRFECVNGGVSAADSQLLRELLEREWLALRPAVVVINLSNNDGDTARLVANVEEMARLALSAGARPLLVLEPNTTEDPESDQVVLRANHEALRQLGARLGLTVVDMHAHLADLADRGFLWWDNVHLTSFGQRLFAERLVPELQRALSVAVATAPDTVSSFGSSPGDAALNARASQAVKQVR